MAFQDYFDFGREPLNLPDVPASNMNFSMEQLGAGQAANPLIGASEGGAMAGVTPSFINTPMTPPLLNMPGGGGNSWWDSFMGTKTKPGWGTPALGALQSGVNFWLGKEQLGLAKDQLKTSKQQFADQFGAQKKMINADIYNQGKRRFDRNPEGNINPDAYYEKYKI